MAQPHWPGRSAWYSRSFKGWEYGEARRLQTCPAQADGVGLAGARRCINTIRQETGLAAAQASPEAAALAAAVRNECRIILRNPHPLEHF